MQPTSPRSNPLPSGSAGRKFGSWLSVGILCLAVLLSAAGEPARAQSETTAEQTEVPQALGPESMQALVEKLNESQTAALVELVELLNRSVAGDASPAEAEPPGLVETVRRWFINFGINLERQFRSFPQMGVSTVNAVGEVFKGRQPGGTIIFLLLFALAIGVGMAAEWWFDRSARGLREKISASRPEALIDTLKVLAARAGIEIGDVIVFTVFAIISVNLLLHESRDLFLASTFLLSFVLVVRITAAVLRFVLAPRRPELRLVYADTWTAQFIERNFVAIAVIAGLGFFINAIMLEYGIPHADTLRFWLGMALHLWLIFVILKTHKGLTRIIEGDAENLTPGLRVMASWWPAVAAALVAFNWLFLQFVLSTGYQSLTPERSATAIVLIVLAPFLDTIVRGVAAHLVPSEEGKDAVVAKAYHQTRMSYVRIGRIALLGLLIIVVFKLWGLSLRNLAEAGFGAQIAANGVAFLLILVLGYLAWEITNLVISRRLAKEVPAEAADAETGAGSTRMATILPILRMTLQVTIIVITALLALSQLGVNIAPLLAGAGVIGLAIGFGAQTLVKDVVSGVFFLLDDAFRVGEFITVGSTSGIVDKISVRSLQLRQDTGELHIIPYGSMSQMTNNYRDWVTMKLKFTVPFDTDQDKVRKLFKQIGQEMMEEPELAAVLINPFKSQGAAAVTDVGIVIRGKFTTKPGGQFLIRKEVYNRVQKAFEANGIEFARKEVRVRLPEHLQADDLDEEDLKAVSAAAAEAADSPAR